MKGLIDNKIYREDERLIGEEKASYVRSCRRQLLASFIASLMSFSSGTVVAGWTSTATRFDEDSELMAWSSEQESWIISIYVFGALIGALPVGFLSQKFGRKSILLWLALPMTAGWIICLMKLNNMALECIGRILCGISLGATNVAVPLYASDVSSDVLRGRTGVFLDFMLCAGIQYAYVLRTMMGLRHFCIACALVPIIFVIMFSYMPESPVYLFNKGRYNEATAALRWLRGTRFNIKIEFEKIEKSQWKNSDLLYNGKMNAENKKYLKKALIVSFGLVLVQRLSGAGGIIQYSNVLFKMSGNTIDANLACIILGYFQLVASGASFLLIDKIGRRTLLLISSAIVTTCLLLLVIFYILYYKEEAFMKSSWKISIIFILYVFISAFRLGLGPIPWFICTELMPAEYCGRTQSILVTFSWFLSFIIMKTFKIFLESCPIILWSSFFTYSTVGLIFITIFVPETNNKSREQIRLEL